MSDRSMPAWCRACGAESSAGAASNAGSCGHCQTSRQAPAAGPARVGRVVETGGRLLSKPGVAVRETAASVEVLVKADGASQVPTEQFDQLRQIDVPGPAVIGAAGRLLRVIQASHDRKLKGKWSLQAVQAAASEQATADIGSRRAAAIDAITLGLGDAPGRLGLSPSEVAWYQARAAAVAGRTADAIGWLEQLPAPGYAARVPLLVRRAQELLRDDALGARAAALLAPFAATVLEARALRAALTATPAAGSDDEAELLLPLAAQVTAQPDSALMATTAAVVRLERPPHVPAPGMQPALLAFDAYLAGCSGSRVDSAVQSLAALPLPLLDQLIELGALTSTVAGHPAWPAQHAAYLRCRLDPGGASVEEAQAAGFTDEVARRCYQDHDDAALAGLPGANPAALASLPRANPAELTSLPGGNDADVASLPAGNPVVRHYQALAAWRSGTEASGLDGLRPAARELLQKVDFVHAETAAGRECVVPEEVAADPTCWPPLWAGALRGGLQISDETRRKHSRFADWLDTCQLQRLVFDGSWPEVSLLGRQLAERAELEVTSDEAQNMVAFAESQLGRDADALAVLDEALTGRYTTGLIVNASIVAAAQGSVAALPYLARIIELESDPEVRLGAMQRAVALWLADDKAPDYPQILREKVRRMLGDPLPDDFQRTLLLLAFVQDDSWLASTTSVRTLNSQQSDAVRYFRVRAKSSLDAEQDTTLKDVAAVLASLASAAAPAEWVTRELDRFIDNLDEAVHCDFGEAMFLAPVIEVLLSAGVLPVVPALFLAAQAGAHVAVYLQENGDNTIRTDSERKFLFDPVQRYHAEAAGLTESEREYVGSELAKCLSAAAASMSLTTSHHFTRRMAEWNELVRREQYDFQNRPAILREERALLDDLDSCLQRLGPYLRYLADLPLNDKQRELRTQIIDETNRGGAEVLRLRRFL